jgi:branched-chain amino acid transport system substrate-binding protein
VAKGMTFIDGFYWDADDQARTWSKQFFDRRKVMPTMSHAGVYSSVHGSNPGSNPLAII